MPRLAAVTLLVCVLAIGPAAAAVSGPQVVGRDQAALAVSVASDGTAHLALGLGLSSFEVDRAAPGARFKATHVRARDGRLGVDRVVLAPDGGGVAIAGGLHGISVRTFTAGGRAGPVQKFGHGFIDTDDDDLATAIAPDGSAILAYTFGRDRGKHQQAVFSLRAPGGHFGPLHRIPGLYALDASLTVGAGPGGDAVVALKPDTGHVVQVELVRGGHLEPRQSFPAGDGGAVAMGADGSALLATTRLDLDSGFDDLTVSSAAPGATSFGAGVEHDQRVDDDAVLGPYPAIGPDGSPMVVIGGAFSALVFSGPGLTEMTKLKLAKRGLLDTTPIAGPAGAEALVASYDDRQRPGRPAAAVAVRRPDGSFPVQQVGRVPAGRSIFNDPDAAFAPDGSLVVAETFFRRHPATFSTEVFRVRG